MGLAFKVIRHFLKHIMFRLLINPKRSAEILGTTGRNLLMLTGGLATFPVLDILKQLCTVLKFKEIADFIVPDAPKLKFVGVLNAAAYMLLFVQSTAPVGAVAYAIANHGAAT